MNKARGLFSRLLPFPAALPVAPGLRIALSMLIALCLLIPATASGGTGGEAGGERRDWVEMSGRGYTEVCEIGGYSLSADPYTGFFLVTDLLTGHTIGSNPADYADDEYTRGFARGMLASQLGLTCLNSKGDVTGEAIELQSMADSLLEGGMSMFRCDDGLRYRFEFPLYGLCVYMDVILEDGLLRVRLPLDEGFTDTGDCRILAITVLPYFNAGGLEEDGFILIPDGSGGIINFNNDKQTLYGYSQRIYGEDAASAPDILPINADDAFMPVFGISKKNGAGSFSIITQGASLATVRANVAKGVSAYNNAYAVFQIRGYEQVTSLSRTWAENRYTIAARERESGAALEIAHRLFTGTDTAIMDMALFYRDYLVAGGLRQREIDGYNVFLDVYMGVRKKKQFLGFVYNGYETLTTFAEARAFAEGFYSAGFDGVDMRVLGASPDGAYGGPISKDAAVARPAGGLEGYRELQDYLAETGGALFYGAGFAAYGKSSLGFSKLFDRAVTLEQKPAQIYQYRLSILERRLDVPPLYLLKNGKTALAAERFAAAAKKRGIAGVALSDIASKPYSSYNNGNYTSREQMLEGFSTAADALSAAAKLMMEAPSAALLTRADKLTGMPTGGNNIDIVDENVPFYAMALHGYLPYASKPLNLSSDPGLAAMRAVECGASPAFAFTGGDYSALSDTPLDFLYSAQHAVWAERANSISREMAAAIGDLAGKRITGFSMPSPGVHVVTYENGATLVFNYGQAAYDYAEAGVSVAPGAYVRLDNG